MSKQNEEKNVLTTGGLPSGTYNAQVSSEEIANVDHKIIEEMKKKLAATKKFQVNQIVKGVYAGRFIVLGYREINGKEFVQVKAIDQDGTPIRGEMALEENVLEEIY